MIAAFTTRLSVALGTLSARNLWTAVAILLNTLTASAMPALKGAPVGPLPVVLQAGATVLPGLRGSCEPGSACAFGRMADPVRLWAIRTPSRTRSWRYRAVFG